ncbi:unnamed protein product [Laminaria digitata]
MLGCLRARTLLHARRRRPPFVRPLPSSWVVRFASTSDNAKDDNSPFGNTSGPNSSSSSSGGSGSSDIPFDGSLPPGSEHNPGFEQPPALPPPADGVPSQTEPWSNAQEFLTDFPGSLTPLASDAAMYMLSGIFVAGGHIVGGLQSGVQGVHAATGLPWWATIAVTTMAVKISLLPVVVHQARHHDRLRMAWPEIQTLRGHLATTLEEIPQRRVLARWRKYRVFFSGVRGIIGLHGAHPLGLIATPLVNLPVFVMFVWSIRSMLRDATVPGLDTGGMLWFVDLTVSDSSLMLPIIGTVCTYFGLELAKMKNATGWIRFFQDGMQTFIIMMLPWISTFPQASGRLWGDGVFMYWIPSSLFQASQTLAMRNESVRQFLGLQPLRQAAPPPTPAGGNAQLPSKAVECGSSQETPRITQVSLTAGGIPAGNNARGDVEAPDGVKSAQ